MKEKVQLPRWAVFGIGLAAVLVICLGVVFALPKNSDNTSDSGPGPETAGVQASSCGAGSSDNDAVRDVKPKNTEWVTTDAGFTGPKSKTAGPLQESPLYTCFEHSAEGALYASVWYLSQIQDPDTRVTAIEQLAVDSPGKQAALDEYRKSTPTRGQNSILDVEGYKFLSYSPDRASIRIAFSAAGKKGSVDMTLVWDNGDWKMRVPDSKDMNIVSLDSFAGFIKWSS